MPLPPAGYTCSKQFEGYPCCHRQWQHPGHCRFVHGYSRSFTFWFAATELDACGFVVDFSSLRPLEKRLRDQFDHTFLVNQDDPLLEQWTSLHEQGALRDEGRRHETARTVGRRRRELHVRVQHAGREVPGLERTLQRGKTIS